MLGQVTGRDKVTKAALADQALVPMPKAQPDKAEEEDKN